MEHIGPVLHDLDVLGGGVVALTVHDGPLKHVAEFGFVAEEVWPDKVHHTPVLHQAVLQRVPGQDNPPPEKRNTTDHCTHGSPEQCRITTDTTTDRHVTVAVGDSETGLKSLSEHSEHFPLHTAIETIAMQ